MKKNKEKASGKKIVIRLLDSVALVVLACVFIYSAYKTYEYGKELHSSKNEIRETRRAYVSDTVKTEPSIKVDFDKMKKTNSDIVAWLYSPDTPLSYPVVKGEDNEYYLYRLLDGTWNTNGTLFVDYRCNSFSRNTIIYGHNMKSGNMFGELVGYKKQSYYDKHPVMYLLTSEGNYKLNLYAGVVVESDSEIYKPEISDDNLAIWKDCSTFQSDVTIRPEDRIVTLSTCSYEYDNARFVVIGVMQPMQPMPVSEK